MKIYFLKLYIIILVFFLSFNWLFSQNKFEISGGVAIPELINLKFKYGNHFQIGGGIGIFQQTQIGSYFKPYLSQVFPISLDLYYNFLKSDRTGSYKWHLANGITYVNAPDPDDRRKYLYYNLRIGRIINFTKQTGLNLDLGTSIFEDWYIYTYRRYPNFGVSENRNEISFYPISGNISFFIKF
jgi:hypothetical protein